MANAGLPSYPQSHCLVVLANPQDLGYPLELGYQNFLYPSEPDLRDLLLFLAERLPTDASEDADQPAGTGSCRTGETDCVSRVTGAERGGRKGRGQDVASGDLGGTEDREQMDTRQVARSSCTSDPHSLHAHYVGVLGVL